MMNKEKNKNKNKGVDQKNPRYYVESCIYICVRISKIKK